MLSGSSSLEPSLRPNRCYEIKNEFVNLSVTSEQRSKHKNKPGYLLGNLDSFKKRPSSRRAAPRTRVFVKSLMKNESGITLSKVTANNDKHTKTYP